MEKLKQVCEARKLAVSDLARQLKVATSTVAQWLNGKRPVPARHCPAIEGFFGGEISRRDLRPDDWQEIWPELAQTPLLQMPAGMVLIPDRRVATEPRRAVDRERDSSQTGQGIAGV